MKTFETPKIEIIKFIPADIITTSGGGGNNELPPIGLEDSNQLNVTPMG